MPISVLSPSEEHQLMRTVLEMAELGLWRHDLRTGEFMFDARGQAHYGAPAMRGHAALLIDRIHADDRARLDADMTLMFSSPGRGQFESEYRVVHADGSVRCLRARVLAEYEGEGAARRAIVAYGTSQDVTASHAAERLMREQAQLLHDVSEIAQVGGWEFDPSNGVTTWTEETAKIYGVERHESLRATGLEGLSGESRVRVELARQEALQHGTPFDLDVPLTSATGDSKWVRLACRPVMEEGRVSLLRGTLQDITTRKRAEQALSRFVHASPSVIYALAVEDSTFRLVWVGGDLERMTGWRPHEVTAGAWWYNNIHPDDRARVLASNPEPFRLEELSMEFRFRRRDGSYLWLHDKRRLLRDANGVPTELVGSWSDVTERVELEAQFRHAQKMDGIGQLAGGVAHDFNNLLTVILGSTEVLSSTLKGDEESSALVDEIRAASERAASLTRQLLAFSRRQVVTPSAVDVNSEIDRLQRLLRRLIGESVAIVCDLDSSAGEIHADSGQFEQIIVNLAVNARDAMPSGGTLTIATRSVPAMDGSECERLGLVAGPYVQITVGDTGVGMSPEVLAHIFEPFFTTKPAGHGTGLGLATVFGIVKQSGGHIDVHSAVGAGSTFEIVLPRCAPQVAPMQVAPMQVAPMQAR